MSKGKAKRKHKAQVVALVPKVPDPTPVRETSPLRNALTDAIIERSRKRKRRRPEEGVTRINPFAIPTGLHPPSVMPEVTMAMDDELQVVNTWAVNAAIAGVFAEGQAFLGYPLLSEMAQRPEYRSIVETIARHMTHKWITFSSKAADAAKAEAKKAGKPAPVPLVTPKAAVPPAPAQDALPPAMAPKPAVPAPPGETAPPVGQQPEPGQQPPPAENTELIDDKSDKIAELKAEIDRLHIKDAFRQCLEIDGFFGRGHLYIDTGATDNPDELKTPLLIEPEKIAKGSLKGVRPVEAVWCYPTNYNSSDPLQVDWFRPSTWMVMGKQIDASRFLTLVGRKVPDLLKPAYSFGGLSMTQMAKPYVDNWLRTRQAVSDAVVSFSTFVLEMNLVEDLMMDGGEVLFRRAEFFNNLRDNQGLLMIDKKGEGFQNVSMPLGTLDSLQAQSQEQMASVSGIPLVELLGIQPAGLNASSEGEIKTYDENINTAQENEVRDPLTKVVHMVMLSLWGEVDDDLVWDFAPLRSLTDLEAAQKRQTEAETDTSYVNMGAIDASEVRKKLIDDPDSPYQGLPDEPPAPDPGEMFGGMMGMPGMPPMGGAPPPGQPPGPKGVAGNTGSPFRVIPGGAGR